MPRLRHKQAKSCGRDSVQWRRLSSRWVLEDKRLVGLALGTSLTVQRLLLHFNSYCGSKSKFPAVSSGSSRPALHHTKLSYLGRWIGLVDRSLGTDLWYSRRAGAGSHRQDGIRWLCPTDELGRGRALQAHQHRRSSAIHLTAEPGQEAISSTQLFTLERHDHHDDAFRGLTVGYRSEAKVEKASFIPPQTMTTADH